MVDQYEIPHRDPIIILVYQIVLYIEFSISFAIYPLVIYTIFRKSPQEMGLFPWFLSLNITANYVYCFLMCIWQVVPLPPFYMAYPAGLTRYFGSWMAYFHMELVVFSSLNMVLTLGIALAYRYGQTGAGLFAKLFTNSKLFVIGSVVVFVSFHLAGTGSLIYSRVDIEQLKNLTRTHLNSTQLLDFNYLLSNETIFGYAPELNPTIVNFVQNGLFGGIVGIPSVIIFNMLQGAVFCHNRVRVTPSGAFGHHQLTFWKTLLSRSAALIILLLVPYMLLILILKSKEPDEKHLALGYIVIMGSYFTVDSLFLMMCESHYTKFFFTKIKQLCRLEIGKIFTNIEATEPKVLMQQQAVIMFSKF